MPIDPRRSSVPPTPNGHAQPPAGGTGTEPWLIDIGELSRLTSISVRQLRRLDASGDITITLKDGGSFVYRKTFRAEDCVEKKGKIKCRSGDKDSKVKFAPNKKLDTPGAFKVKIGFKNLSIGNALASEIDGLLPRVSRVQEREEENRRLLEKIKLLESHEGTGALAYLRAMTEAVRGDPVNTAVSPKTSPGFNRRTRTCLPSMSLNTSQLPDSMM